VELIALVSPVIRASLASIITVAIIKLINFQFAEQSGLSTYLLLSGMASLGAIIYVAMSFLINRTVVAEVKQTMREVIFSKAKLASGH
jgi:hypothetical protein